MKHALIIMKPPYGTQIVTQLDGSIMLKFEISTAKDSILEMLEKSHHEVGNLEEAPELPVTTPVANVTKVVPDLGPIPMVMVAPPSIKHVDIVSAYPTDLISGAGSTANQILDQKEVAKHMQEANKRGQHTET